MRQIILLLLLLSSSLTIIIIIIIIIITDRSYTNFLPIKRVITNDQRSFFHVFNIHLQCFQKPVLSYTFTLFLTCSGFARISLSLPIYPFTFFFFIKSPQPCFHKSYPQSKTFLIIELSLANLFSAVMQCL